MNMGRRGGRVTCLLAATVAVWGAGSLLSRTAGAGQQAGAAPAATVAPTRADEMELEAALAKARVGKVDEALALIKEKATKHPEWPVAQLILGKMLFALNQVAAARQALEQAAVAAPGDPEVFLTFGAIALSEGRISDAKLNFEHVQRLLTAGRFDAAKETMLRCECLAGLASVAESHADWKATADRLRDWLALEPKNGGVRQRFARALFMLDKTDEAFKELGQAVQDKPALEPAGVSMAWLFARKGDADKAQEWFDYAQKAEPKSARVRVARASWLLDRGRAAEASREIDEGVKLDPASTEALRVKALVAWHTRDLAAAETILEPLHRDAPADSMVANLLALALIEQDDLAKKSRGGQLAEVNVLQFPRSPEVVATLGWALYRSGQLEPAEQKLRAAVSGGRTTPDIAYFLACVLAARKQNADARRLLETATKLPGAFAHRGDAQALLTKLGQ